jgi:phosphocarrier protein FPr/phosphocarrier protein
VSTLTLRSPLAGWVMPLEEVPDPVFAGRMLGDGLAIDPTTGVLCAPCDGVLVSVAPTRHAVTLRADNGAELLIHIGIDTVGLDGAGFEALAEAERRVELGAVLLRFDLDLIARRAPSLVTPIIVTNGDRYEIVGRSAGRLLAQGEQLMELRAIGVGAAEDPDQRGAEILRLRLRVPLPHGLHARPAGLIARRAREFDARVTVTAHGRRASAASAVSLMSLGVRRDDEIGLEATGNEARAVLDALAALLAGAAAKAQATRPTAAGEAIAAPAPAAPPAPGTTLPGVVAARGVAIGTAAFVAQRERPVPEMGAGAAHEAAELERARAAALQKRC